MKIKQIIHICFATLFIFQELVSGVTIADAIEAKGPIYNGNDLTDIIGDSSSDFIEMNVKNFRGFYYDVDGGISTEYLRIYGGNYVSDRTINEQGLEYTSSIMSADYECIAWEADSYYVMGLFGDVYVPLKADTSLQLARLIMDDGNRYTIIEGQSFKLGEGYTITPGQIDAKMGTVYLELSKDGNFIDAETLDISNGEATWVYKINVATKTNAEVMRIRVTDAFQGQAGNLMVVEGIWLTDFKNSIEIVTGDTYGVFEVENLPVNSCDLILKNNVPITLSSGSVQELMDELRFVVTDSSEYLEFYLTNEPVDISVYKPDLVIVSANRWSLTENGEYLSIYLDILNQGFIPSDSTSVRIEIMDPEWPEIEAETDVPALDSGEDVTVIIEVYIPEELHGTTHNFAIEIDPENYISEMDENNNLIETPVIYIPELLPDLVITDVSSYVTENYLEIYVDIANHGTAFADSFIVSTVSSETSHQWSYSENVVDGLYPGEDITLEIVLEIPDGLPGQSNIDIIVDPDNTIKELDESNNAWSQEMIVDESIGRAPIDEFSDDLLEPETQPEWHDLDILLGIILPIAVIGGFLVLYPRLVKLKWEAKAIEKCLEDCPPGTEYCLKEICLKPGSCKITKLHLKACTSEDCKKKTIEGDIISDLNRIRTASYQSENPDVLLHEVETLASKILEVIILWLTGKAESYDVSISADIDLGEATCKYTRYICNQDSKPGKNKSWEKTVKGCNRSIGTLNDFDIEKANISEKLQQDFSRMMMQFIEGV
ncbi:S-layer protein domain-containing protein [Methanolobus sediminis]|uniref:S-layer protein domain-containing protein n=1 Tax=Methanolobus sediminis TaxID=3072978 RepID=A0AA51UJ56_9EURY|nr:S-layer protein domain-containing protein [Methanolobus sediminis]WMW24516.1 S-layer protein domain-containing protein [Methanolobus sediminis]